MTQQRRRVVLTGATGMIGGAVYKELLTRGYDVVVFSRDPQAARAKLPGAVDYVQWEAVESGPWAAAIDGVYAVINCGAAPSFGQRWTGSRERYLNETRILGTRGLVNAMAAARVKPQVLVNSSSHGYYGLTKHTAQPVDESSPAGTDSWAKTNIEWDAEALKATQYGIRPAIIRMGYVLGAHDGGLAQQVAQVRQGRGGATTPTDAWRPWIHIDDVAGLFMLGLEDERVNGGLNATAPNPVTSREFADTLARHLGAPTGKTFPGWALRLFIGKAAVMMTNGKRVVPTKALALGYRFKFPTLDSALDDLLPQMEAVKA